MSSLPGGKVVDITSHLERLVKSAVDKVAYQHLNLLSGKHGSNYVVEHIRLIWAENGIACQSHYLSEKIPIHRELPSPLVPLSMEF